MKGTGVRPTGRGVAASIGVLVIGAGAYLGGLPELIYPATLVAMLLLVGLVHVGIAAAMPRPDVERTVSTSAPFAHETFGVTLTSASPRRIGGTWSDARSVGLTGRSEGAASALAQGADYEVTANRRGWHRLGPCEIRYPDVFGLWRLRRTVTREHEVLVLPAIESFTGDGPERDGGDAPESGHVGQALRDPDIIPREYRPGDPLSRIHWKATARRDQLMVRDDERKADLSALVVLDLRRSGETDAVDRAVAMAGSTMTHLVDSGYTVRLRGLGCEPRIDSEIDAATGLLDAMRALAVVAPGGTSDPPPRGGVRLVVVIGPRPRPWPVRAPHKVSVTTGILTDDDRRLIEPMGWHTAHFGDGGSPARTWSALNHATAGRIGA